MAALRLILSHLFVLMLNCYLSAASVKTSRGGAGSAQDSGFLHSSSLDPLLDDLDQDMVSQHMFRLYEKCSRENRLREGNTVRSFRASQDSSSLRMVYQLNLTSLQDSEVILSATFHFLLDRRPPHKPWFCKRFKSPSCRSSAAHPPSSISLLLRSVSSGSEIRAGSTGSFLGNLTFHPHRRGAWQMKDVTQVIKEARDKGHLLLLVEVDSRQHYHVKPEEALSAGGLPYLLVHANDQALAEPNSVAGSLQRYDPFSEEGEHAHPSQSSSAESRGRVRREAPLISDTIQNNELPEVDYRPEGYRKDDLWESTWYLALKPKHKSGKKRKIQEEESKGANVKKEEVTGRTLQEVKKLRDSHKPAVSDGQKHERKNEGKSGKKHKASTNSQSPVLNFDEQTMRKARRKQWADSQQRGCARRNLRVDFADIGWSEWVIAPKAFDAYYCAGACGFPMPKVAKPSNHATIQSIVRAVGIIPGVPEPCCVPEKMSPLPVLYQDESRNPVLKIYPNMSVQSCSCR